jgi:MFS family permease
MDVAGMLLLALTLLAGMLAASFLGERNPPLGPLALGLLVLVALAGGWAFVRHVGRSPAPFIAPRLIHGPGFGAVNLVNMVYGGIAIGAMVLLPLYASTRYGLDALDAGALLFVQGGASIVMSLLATLALRRSGYRLPLYAGGAISAAGVLLIALAPPWGIAPQAWLMGAALLAGVGTGVVNPASRNAGLQLAPEHSASIAGLRSLCFQVGTIAVISLATAAMADTAHSGVRQAWVYAAVALLLAAALPLVRFVPEHRGAW